jgi:hypothetical protein
MNLLFMSLEDVHEPRGRLLTGGCTLVKDPDPPQGLEEDLNEFSQDLAFTSLQEPDGTIHVWYSLRRSPERFLVEDADVEQASARSHSESPGPFSVTRPGWDPTKMTWQVCYARTRDGIHFERPDLGIVPDPKSPNVLIDAGGIFSVMRNDEADPDRRYAMVHTGWGPGHTDGTLPGHHPVHNAGAAFSPDGLHWQEWGHGPAFRDGNDAFSTIYDPRSKLYRCYQAVKRPYPMEYPDSIAPNHRRVMAIRSSDDGAHWSRLENFIEPDADDPPDLEFYMFTVFPYRDRFVGLQRNYARSPLMIGEHGPHISYEWWVSHDGLRWQRPARDMHAGVFTTCTPFVVDDRLCFLEYNTMRRYSTPIDRMTWVGSQSNAEFSSRVFEVPERPLTVNIESGTGTLLPDQAYVMVEVRQPDGQVIEGYEREKCVFIDMDGTALPLRWGEKDTSGLTGRDVCLRFYLRDARIYAVNES